MKMFLMLAALLGASITSANAATTITGDKILFQSVSTYVSAVYDASLCLDGANYEAIVNKCTQWVRGSNDKEVCAASIKVRAIQPVRSTALRCAEFSGQDDKTCARWEQYALIQKPVRTVNVYEESDSSNARLVKTYQVAIPACGN